MSDAVAAGNKARRLGITCHRHGGGAHDAADAYEADAVAVGGGRRTRRRQQGVVEAVLEAPEVAGVRRGVLPAVGVARLVAAAELGHGRRAGRCCADNRSTTSRQQAASLLPSIVLLACLLLPRIS